MIDIKHNVSGKVFQVDPFWLRDHCRCNECYNEETKQRRYNLYDISPDIRPAKISIIVNGQLQVAWDDGHTSVYDIDFLYNCQIEQINERRAKSNRYTTWNKEIAKTHETEMRVTLPELVQLNGSAEHKFVSSLIRYGIAFVDEIPPTTICTELALRRVFPIMRTFFGDMFTFSDVKDHADTAYTKEYLGPHTDNTYFCDAAGLHSLHCISHVNGSGGENFFIDGLHIALELKQRNPNAFELLSRVHVPGEYVEQGEHHIFSAPIIRIDSNTGEILQLRVNVYDRAVFNSIPQSEMREFYDALRALLQLTQSDEMQWTFKLHPGSFVVFDNWRILHARHPYTGHRTMTGAYVQRTDFLSKARTLGIIE